LKSSRTIPKIGAALTTISVFVGSMTLATPASAQEQPVYRVNAGARAIATEPRWTRDTARRPSRFLVSNDVARTRTHREINLSSPSLEEAMPRKLFATGRSAIGGPLTWAFPVAAGNYEVRLYFAETYRPAFKVGGRVMDVVIEGDTVLEKFDVFARVGGDKAYMKSFLVASDDVLNVSLKAITGRPHIKAIEVVEPFTTTGSKPKPEPEPEAEPEPNPDSECKGEFVAHGDNLTSVAASKPAGTTFCIDVGTHKVSAAVKVQSGDRFIGVSDDATFVATDSAPFVFDASGSNGARITGIDISGATGNEACRPKCGRGIWPGDNTTVSHVSLHDNANQGIGGAGPGLLIEDSEIYRNGSEAFVGCCGGGVKSGTSYTIRDSFVHHNIGNGIWCDVTCPRFVVENNVVRDNSRNGIRYEHGIHVSAEVASKGSALIVGNLVTGSNTSRNTPGGGIEVNSASNVIIDNNTLGSTIDAAGINVRGSRHALSNIAIRDNTMGGDKINGCSLSGVTCLRNL
jgi:hypothetical protein